MILLTREDLRIIQGNYWELEEAGPLPSGPKAEYLGPRPLEPSDAQMMPSSHSFAHARNSFLCTNPAYVFLPVLQVLYQSYADPGTFAIAASCAWTARLLDFHVGRVFLGSTFRIHTKAGTWFVSLTTEKPWHLKQYSVHQRLSVNI